MHPSVYVTTAIPYVNSAPHLGFASELVLADYTARAHRQRGLVVTFQTGTDENSLKNVRAAARAGESVEALVATNAALFRNLAGPLGLSVDNFVRTSADPGHARGVEALWRACARADDIYVRSYGGWYCVGCEQFVEQHCPEHSEPPEWVEAENYFFRLSRYQSRIERWLASNEVDIQPEHYRKALLSFVRGGLQDFSISRSVRRAHGWGIGVPGDSEQVIYVWFDALANYITGLGYGTDGRAFDRRWTNASARQHVLGKGVLKFHGIYWPAILASAGLVLPTHLFVHGYVTVDGKKIGKSLGNGVDPVALAQEYSSDALRYFILRHLRTHEDADFSVDKLNTAVAAELRGQLGNLLRRTTRLIENRCGGVVPGRAPLPLAIQSQVDAVTEALGWARDTFRPHVGLEAIWALVATLNRYLAQTQPWSADDRAASVALAIVSRGLLVVARSLVPFLPDTSARIFAELGGGAPGAEVRTTAPLF